MYKRYAGNSGKVTLVEDHRIPPPPPGPPGPPPPPFPRPPGRPGHRPHRPPPPPPRPGPPPRPPGPWPFWPGLELETEDLLLALILYLLYRESGDSEWLMIIGAMFLL